MKDQKNDLALLTSTAPIVIATDTTTVGAIIDTKNYESMTFLLNSGVVTDGAYAILVEDGDDSGLSDAAAVDDEFLIGTEANAAFALTDDGVSKTLGYNGHKRFVRLSIVSTSTATGGLFNVSALLGNPMVRKDVTNLDAA